MELSKQEKIKRYKDVLEGDMRYLFLASLISSDNLLDEQSCINSLDEINFIKDNIKSMNLENESEILKYLKKGTKIVKKDLNKYKN